MFVNKYSLLRRIISLTVASLMILAFTPGIAVIADPDDPLQITSPAEGSLVRNPVSLSGKAIIPEAREGGWHIAIVWDWNEQITQPDDTIDINIPNDAVYPYTADWPTATSSKDHNYPTGSDGNKTIKVWLYSGPTFNITAFSETRAIKVDNTLPQINLTNPENNAAVSNKEDNVEITAKAKDVNEINFVDFYILDHETLSETDTPKWSNVEPSSEPDAQGWYTYSKDWNTLQEDIGTLYVTIVAVDKAGNLSSVTHKVFVTRYGEVTVGPAGTGETPPNIPTDYGTEQEQVKLEVPANALTAEKTLTLEVVPISLPGMPTPPQGYTVLPRAYRFGPSLTFSGDKEVTLTFRYTEDELQGKDESKLGVYYYDSSKGWVYQTDTDTVNGTITIKVKHFSDFGLFIDTVPPEVTSTSPANNATGVAVTSKVTATFSEDMDSSSVTGIGSFTLGTNSTTVGGTVTYDAATKTATFTPSANLAYNTEYKAKISTNVKDLFGNNMTAEKVWTFKTNVQPPSVPTGLTATLGDGVINLTWNSVTGATGYKVYYGTTSGSYGTPIDVGNVTSYQLTGLTNGVTYYIAISAYNASAESSKSTQITAKPSGNYGLTITKTVDKANASLNDTLTYTITYKNTGNSGLNNVQLTDPIPSGTTYVANSATAGTYDATANSISLTVASLTAGSEGTLSFKVTVVPTATGTIVNTASIKSTEITTAKTASASTTIAVASPVAAAGGDAAATGTLGPAPTAGGAKATTAATAKKLPRTGMELVEYLLTAMLLLASGFGLQFVGRREEM